MQNDKRRKPSDPEALRLVRWTLIKNRRYRVVLVLDPKIPKPRIARAFNRSLTWIVDGYNKVWKDDNGRVALEVARLRQSKKKWERTPAHIAQVVGRTVWQVERMIYKKPAQQRPPAPAKQVT